MRIISTSLSNIRGFIGNASLGFSEKINIIVGPNNSGKSTILNSILSLQKRTLSELDLTIFETSGSIQHHFDGRLPQLGYNSGTITANIHRGSGFNWSVSSTNGQNSFTLLPDAEPGNAIYPYSSKRKVGDFSEDIRVSHSNSVTGNLQHLYAKIDRLNNPDFPAHNEYKSACINILGFHISTINSANGKKAVYILTNFDYIPIESMGEGVSNLLGLIVDLCVAKDKIFIIEELENDIHPKALKALLELIELKSENNQFFISTHSNIVTKHLGSIDSAKVFRVSMHFDSDTRLPVSEVREVNNTPSARMRVLEELGYEPFDFGHWKAWLILEESSAEELIRDFLIPKFIPKLKDKLRTYSARAVGEIKSKFRDFNNLFVFVHLEEIYKNKAWVIADAGDQEEKIISELREMYSKRGWNNDNFLQFSEHNFENYYPDSFREQVDEILKIEDKNLRRDRKSELLRNLKQWISDNPELAKEEFAISAKDVIDILKTISKQIN